jgi:hypothetical protein
MYGGENVYPARTGCLPVHCRHEIIFILSLKLLIADIGLSSWKSYYIINISSYESGPRDITHALVWTSLFFSFFV